MLKNLAYSGVLVELTLLLQLIGLTFAILLDPYIQKKHRKIMLLNIAVGFSLLMQNHLNYMLDASDGTTMVRTLVSIYGYCVRPIVLVLFFYIVGNRRSYWPAWVLIGINAAIHLTALFSDVCFAFDENNHFYRGPLGFSCHIVSGILLLWLLWITAKSYTVVRKREILIPACNVILIVAALLADTFANFEAFPVTFLTIAVVTSSVFYYIWLHLQFVRAHEKALMAEQQIQIMMSQIQPHFLYNTLSTIQALCKIDPEKAFDTTEKFGTYLRQNINSLRQPSIIPVQKELEHVRIYTEIEQIRFPSVHVTYDTPDLDFQIPALTIQPIVENAIRHGVRIRDKGLVTVSTQRLPEMHKIVVKDNGKGFDVAAIQEMDDTHIGIRNVRARLEQLCGGTLTVESSLNEGTTVTINIPNTPRKLNESR